jgi:hypothetical protein
MSAKSRHPLWLLSGFWICVAISIFVVIRRLIALSKPPSNSALTPLADLNNAFSSHAALTMAHIIPAALFVCFAVVVLLRLSSAQWLFRLFFLLGGITGVTAYAMNMYAVGGWIERSAVLVFNTWFLFSLGWAFGAFRRGEFAIQREWTVRACAILLGIATTRPVMGVFFATSPLTHWTPRQFFGIAFWVGFSINSIAVEFWIRSRKRAQMHAAFEPATSVAR